jgi:uncharacterized integral membrane protein (TIGR00698 family)
LGQFEHVASRASRILFFVGLILAASGFISPPFALLAGLIFGLTTQHPYPNANKYLVKYLLQGSVVLLGFGMNLHEVIYAGRAGFLYTAIGIALAMIIGLGFGYLLKVSKKAAFLISAGTAICGGSAIAAVGPIIAASEEEMAVSLGAVFILNSVALFIFPLVGYGLHLTQSQFGLWAALAIHDTSSVVGAAAKYGPSALAIATTIKLTRALWILPLSLLTAAMLKSKARIQWPWFILLFCLAALMNSWLPAFHATFGVLTYSGKIGLTITLLLIGTGLNRQTMRLVGARPLLQGLILWITVGVGSLALILCNWIRI